jgi:hypothetical protein
MFVVQFQGNYKGEIARPYWIDQGFVLKIPGIVLPLFEKQSFLFGVVAFEYFFGDEPSIFFECWILLVSPLHIFKAQQNKICFLQTLKRVFAALLGDKG